MAKSFNADVLPMFRLVDINHMKPRRVFLDDYQFMSDPAANATFADHANARKVYSALADSRMPPGGPYWSPDQLKIFQQWMDDGFDP
jgi:hypothetical protein